MATPLNVFVNESASDPKNALVRGFKDTGSASQICISQGDTARPVEVHLLEENTGEDNAEFPFRYVDPTDVALKIGIGSIAQPATGGTFTITDSSASQTTAAIAYGASAATVQSAIRAALTTNFASCTVSGSAGGPWTVDRVTTGAFTTNLTATTAGLTPVGAVAEIKNTQDGTSLISEVWTIQLFAPPAILANLSASYLPSAAVAVTPIVNGGANTNEIQQVDWNADAYAGSVSLSIELPSVASIVSVGTGSPAIATTTAAHRFQTGDSVTFSGVAGSTPDVNGNYSITYVSPTEFSIDETVTVAGTGGVAESTITRAVGPIPFDVSESEFISLLAQHGSSKATSTAFDVSKLGAGSYQVTFKGTLGNTNILAMTASQSLKVPVGLVGTLNSNTTGVATLLSGRTTQITTNLEIEKTVGGEISTVAFRDDVLLRPEMIANQAVSSSPLQLFQPHAANLDAIANNTGTVATSGVTYDGQYFYASGGGGRFAGDTWQILDGTDWITVLYASASAGAPKLGFFGTVPQFQPSGVTVAEALETLGLVDSPLPDIQILSEIGTTRTLALSDSDTWIRCSNNSGCTVTIPPQSDVAWKDGTEIAFEQTGDGSVSIAFGLGVTLNCSAAYQPVSVQKYSVIMLKRTGLDEWTLTGERLLTI